MELLGNLWRRLRRTETTPSTTSANQSQTPPATNFRSHDHDGDFHMSDQASDEKLADEEIDKDGNEYGDEEKPPFGPVATQSIMMGRPVSVWSYHIERSDCVISRHLIWIRKGNGNIERLPLPIVDDLPPGPGSAIGKLADLPKVVYLSDYIVGLIESARSLGVCPIDPVNIGNWWPMDYRSHPTVQLRHGRSSRGKGWPDDGRYGLCCNPEWREMHTSFRSVKRRAQQDPVDSLLLKRARLASTDRSLNILSPKTMEPKFQSWLDSTVTTFSPLIISREASIWDHSGKGLAQVLDLVSRDKSRTLFVLLEPSLEAPIWDTVVLPWLTSAPVDMTLIRLRNLKQAR